jgi:hypothetical protein
MTKRQARIAALRLVYQACEKHLAAGPDEGDDPLSHEDRVKVEDAFDVLAQQAYERWHRASGGPDETL